MRSVLRPLVYIFFFYSCILDLRNDISQYLLDHTEICRWPVNFLLPHAPDATKFCVECDRATFLHTSCSTGVPRDVRSVRLQGTCISACSGWS